jgi:hypothetical protein
VAGKFSATGSMSVIRTSFTATLLADGRVLVAGGSGDTSAELYDPTTGTFSKTGPMTARTDSQTAVLLADGRVLLVGGTEAYKSAELYWP